MKAVKTTHTHEKVVKLLYTQMSTEFKVSDDSKGISISTTVCIPRKQVKTGYYDEMECVISVVLSLLRSGVFCI